MNVDVRELCGVLAATANRILVRLTAGRALSKSHKHGHWAYYLNYSLETMNQ